jgi:hypothetical protein
VADHDADGQVGDSLFPLTADSHLRRIPTYGGFPLAAQAVALLSAFGDHVFVEDERAIPT